MNKCEIVVKQPEGGRSDSVMTINYIEGLDYKTLDCANKLKYMIAEFNEKKLMKWVTRQSNSLNDIIP